MAKYLAHAVLISLCLVSLLASGAWAIRIISAEFPDSVSDGGTAQLQCNYDLEGERLYSINWFKDGAEIFRYMTYARNKKRSYPAKGVTVNINQSDKFNLVLKNWNSQSQGVYKCEVITDMTFKSVKYEKRINYDSRSSGKYRNDNHNRGNYESRSERDDSYENSSIVGAPSMIAMISMMGFLFVSY